MIGSVYGQIIQVGQNWVIVETDSGVGYRVYTGGIATALHESIRFYTYQHIREDVNDLYGFRESSDLTAFELLLTVSGVGPKMAQAIMIQLGRNSLNNAIVNNDPATLRAVSGVGQKVAEKIIIELRNKVEITQLGQVGQKSDEVVNALLGLGYRQSEIVTALQSIDQNLPTEAKLKQALRLLAR